MCFCRLSYYTGKLNTHGARPVSSTTCFISHKNDTHTPPPQRRGGGGGRTPPLPPISLFLKCSRRFLSARNEQNMKQPTRPPERRREQRHPRQGTKNITSTPPPNHLIPRFGERHPRYRGNTATHAEHKLHKIKRESVTGYEAHLTGGLIPAGAQAPLRKTCPNVHTTGEV